MRRISNCSQTRYSKRQKPSKPEPRLDFFTKNFVVLSALVTVASAALAMSTMFGYLNAFDASLVWLVEYPDVIKIILVTAALITTSISPLLNYFTDIHNFVVKKNKINTFFLVITLITPIVIFIYNIIMCIKNKEKYLIEYCIWILLTFYMIVGLIWMGVYITINKERLRDASIIFAMLSLSTFSCYVFGYTYGLHVKTYPGNKHLIISKDGKGGLTEIKDATIVLMTTHHTVLKSGVRIQTLQTPDIIQMLTIAEPP